MGVIDFLLALAQDMLPAALPAVGFAMVFNVPQRALPVCAAGRHWPRVTYDHDDRGL